MRARLKGARSLRRKQEAVEVAKFWESSTPEDRAVFDKFIELTSDLESELRKTLLWMLLLHDDEVEGYSFECALEDLREPLRKIFEGQEPSFIRIFG
jgi:hypothetical protein